jgi:hypothetical protein
MNGFSLLANFIHLSYYEQQALVENLLDWTMVVNFFFVRCQKQSIDSSASSAAGKRRNNWHHPILGWTNERIDDGYFHE